MPSKIFISASDDDQSRMYVTVVKEALFRFNEFPVAAVTLTDIADPDAMNRWEAAKQFIEDSEIFIGIYNGTYGTNAPGQTQSFAELEYRYARDRGLQCLIFVPEEFKTEGDERFVDFRDHLVETHVIHYFSSPPDLQAKVILAISNFKKTRRTTLMLKAIDQSFVEDRDKTVELAVVAPPTELEGIVNQAIGFASDEIEQIVRRALELHEAQRAVQQQQIPTGWLQVNPIFGAPMQHSQFQADIFMITPFRDHFNTIYQEIIRPVVAGLNLTVKRGDDFASTSGVIINEIWAAISACRLVLVETTEVNANVYYELGIAHTLGKPAILLTQEKEVKDLPFDIRHLRFIVYENTISGGEKLEEDLHKAIVWILNDLGETQKEKQT